MSAEPLQLLLRGESGRPLASGGHVGARQRRDVEDHSVVSHQQLHHQGLVRVVHQGGQRHLCVYLPWFHQRRAEDDAQVTRRHLVLLRLLRHSVSAQKGIVSLIYNTHSLTDTLQINTVPFKRRDEDNNETGLKKLSTHTQSKIIRNINNHMMTAMCWQV